MKRGELGQLGPELVGDAAPLRLGGVGAVLSEGGGHEGGDDPPAALAGMGERVAHGVDPAALPGGVHQLGDGGLDALVGVGDDELDAAQAAPSELAQELGPEGLGLRGADVHAQHFAPAVCVDADRDDHRDRDDAVVAAHLHVGGVEPDIGPVAFERPVEEGFDPVVDLLAQPRHLALRDARSAHRPDEIVDRAGRHALDVGLLDHRGQRLLGHPPRLEEARKVRALAQLGDAQFDRAALVSQSRSR